MSNTYATIVSELNDDFPRESKEMLVNAFVGKNGNKSIQLTLYQDYITLTEKQVQDLINILQARLDNKITATGSEDLGEFYPN